MTEPLRSELVLAQELGELWLAQRRAGRIHELDVVPVGTTSRWGAICVGRVLESRPALGGAFVDAGLGQQVFTVTTRRGPPLAQGDTAIIRVVRDDPDKGLRATLDVTLPGLLVVLVPGRPGMRVSRRVPDPERCRLRSLGGSSLPAGDHGWIVRAAAAGASERELATEAEELVETWSGIEEVARAGRPSGPLWNEPGAAGRFVRERIGLDPERVVVGGEALAREVREVLTLPGGRSAVPVVEPAGEGSAVMAWGLEQAADEVLRPVVDLPGGGRLVVQSTAAVAAIDVNGGTDLRGDSAEEAALRVNREAAGEAARQISLRNLAGLIVVDFVDLHTEAARAEVDAALGEALGHDPCRVRVLPMSRFSVAEICRQYQGPELARRLGARCAGCDGAGWRPSVPTEARRLLRRVRDLQRTAPGRRIEAVGPEEVVAEARRLGEADSHEDDARRLPAVRWITGKSLSARLT